MCLVFVEETIASRRLMEIALLVYEGIPIFNKVMNFVYLSDGISLMRRN